jgi:hypothetical protein
MISLSKAYVEFGLSAEISQSIRPTEQDERPMQRLAGRG